MSDAVATQAAYDAGHDRSDHYCLSDPCSWHPGEQRIRPRPAYPATLVTESAETLAEALAKHRLHASMNICTGCDWRATPDAGSLADQHEAHRAAALIASGAVRTAAEAQK